MIHESRWLRQRKGLASLLGLVVVVVLLAVPCAASATALPSTIKENMTLTPTGSPYTGTTTIEPGVTVIVEPGARLTLVSLTVKGTLLAEGTASEPVLFTGKHEESSGEWHGIIFEPGSSASVLDHVDVAYAGFLISSSAITIKDSSPRIVDSVVRENEYYSISVEGGSPTIENDHVIGGTGSYGQISYSATPEHPGSADIQGNLVERGTSGISVSNSSSLAAGDVVSGNTVLGVLARGLSYSGPDIPSDITENTLIGNGYNELALSGTVAATSTWAPPPGGVKILVEGGFTIASGATLTIDPGLVLLMSGSLTVKGTLDAEGIAAEPVVFTGAKEVKAGEWNGIIFEPGSGGSVLDHVEVAYGGSSSSGGMILAKGSHPRITDSTLRASKYYAIKVTESGKPTIERDRFREDAEGLSYSGTGKLNAPDDDWGCPNGPKPAGCGASVTSNVEWKPAASFPEEGGHCRGKESQCGEGADPVSLATGALDYSHTDFSLPSKGGEPLQFTRTYSSGSSADTGLGTGWSQTGLATATELASGEVLVARPDGRQDLFEPEGPDYRAPSGVTDVLTKVEGIFRLTTLEGTVDRFDASGRIAAITDPHGLVTTYAYNSEGRLSTITDPSGQTLTFTYNGSNHITAVKDSTGREVKYGYSATGELETVTDPLGDVTRYAYEGHLLKTITDARGHVILRNVYDGQGRISEQEDGVGGVWRMAYSPGQTTVTEPDGGERRYDFDAQDRVLSETDALGHTTTIAYDAAGQVESVYRPGGADWHLGHDATGNLISVTDPEGGESSWTYDAQDHPTEYTDADGDTWHYEWSASGDLEKQTDPEGGETTSTYDAAGDPVTVTDPDGHESKLAYNTLGERTSLKDPLGHEWTWGYDTRGFETSSTQPGLKAEKLERDSLGDLLSRTTPEGHKASYEYDADGLLVKTTDPAGDIWRIERNAMERPTAYIDPLGHESTVTWDGDLKPATLTNRDGGMTHYRYDAADQLTEKEGPEGETWSSGYDALGDRTSLTDPRGHATDYEYDLLGRLTKTEAPLGSTAEYGYDPAGRLVSWTDPDGDTTDLVYDERGLLTAVERPLGQTTAYEYDPAGQLTGKITAEASLEYAHDEADRLTGISDEGEALRSFGYEPDGSLATAAVTGGPTVTLGWTEDGEPKKIEDGRGQTVEREYDSRGDLTQEVDGRGTVEYAYDALGRIESLTDPEGRTSDFSYDPEGNLTGIGRPGGIDTAEVYDEAGRLAEATTEAGGSTLEALSYGYDADGDPTSVTNRLGESTSYGYDALDRLVESNPPGSGSTTYAYDAAGNRTQAGSTTYAYDALDQLTEDSTGAEYSYDGDGRLVEVEGEAGTTTYSWDALDELTGVEGPTGTSSLAYDALGRLASRTAEGTTDSFHYGDLGDDPILATSEGGPSTAYLQGPSELLVETEEGGEESWPLLDGHGSVVATANGSGEVESRESFGPWGETLEGRSELGYLGGYGRLTDPTTGLVQMGARTYDPALGAFLSQDPVLGHMVDPMTLDPYPYVLDDPLGLYDLDGREPCLPTPLGSACPGEALEAAGSAIGGAAGGAAGVVRHTWERELGNDERNAEVATGAAAGAATVATRTWESGMRSDQQEREFETERAQEFSKKYASSLSDFFHLAGSHREACVEFGGAGSLAGATAGSYFGPWGTFGGGLLGGAVGCGAAVGEAELLNPE
jgi:RHS repeat-associated protein